MTKKSMLIYENVAPVNKQAHAGWGIQGDGTFNFAREVNSVPLTGVEFAAASMEFSIVFTKTNEGAMPIAILGVRSGENLFVDDEGQWQAKYIPAFFRRYPFVFSTSQDNETLTLCLDEAYEGCHKDGTGETLFNEEGENSEYLEKVINFLKEYQDHYQRTLWFGKKLEEFTISREKVKKLSEAQMAELVKNDAMELIYLHLNSMQNLGNTIRRMPTPEQAPELTS